MKVFSTRGFGAAEGRNVGNAVKYNQEVFAKAWDYLVSSSSDGEDDYQVKKRLFPPGIGTKYSCYWADCFFSGRTPTPGNARTNIKGFNLKNAKYFNKIIA